MTNHNFDTALNMLVNDIISDDDRRMIPICFSEDAYFRGSLGTEHIGWQQINDYFDKLRLAFPKFKAEVIRLIKTPDDKQAMAEIKFSGTHGGEQFGIAPTGREIFYGAFVHIKATADNKISYACVVGDVAEMRQKLSS